MNAKEALGMLKEGNQRFTSEQQEHPNQSLERRAELTEGQAPYAVVLCCADSRVSPELMFDCGIGDLFVIRVAGNIIDDAVLGSIEYAAMHLGTKLIVVLGHESCGAVTAAVDGGSTNTHIDALIEAIRPAVEAVGEQDGLLEAAIRKNARMEADKLATSEPALRPRVENEGLTVLPAYYHLKDGRVEFLEEDGGTP